MSSTMSSTEIQTIPKKTIMIPRKMDEKRLVRTSSLEKIRRFNNFICSQQYYVLPALFAWLRSSQSVLQSSTEKTIFFFRSLIFTHFLYKIYQFEFRALISDVLVLARKQIRTLGENSNLLRIAIYLTGSVLAMELGMCFYLLCLTQVPSGLVFLIVCWFYIIYLNIRSVYFSPSEKRNDVIIKKRN